jgi:predicted RNA-binding protein associated with RNAse of E/G family
MAQRFETGDAVALREIWGGRVFAARPATVVQDRPDRALFYVPPVVRCLQARSEDGEPVRIPTRGWRLQDVEWRHQRVLSFAFPQTPYSVLASWDPSTDAFDGWYVNLQAPLIRTDVGFDTREHVLDVLIPADRSTWSWKDEDELAQAVGEGLFSPAEAVGFRAAGERAVEQVLLREPPFDEEWETWRPDPSWPTPALPDSVSALPSRLKGGWRV